MITLIQIILICFGIPFAIFWDHPVHKTLFPYLHNNQIRPILQFDESLISISIDPPSESEKTKSDKQPWITSPSRVTSVPLPEEIVEPVNEKASTVLSLELIVNPDDDASPPDADVTQPL